MKQFPFYGLSGCAWSVYERVEASHPTAAERRRTVIAAVRSETALRWLDRLLLVELVVLTFLLGCFLDKDTDIWWHLRAGREILAGAGIPRVDSYIFAAPAAEWIDLHWGFRRSPRGSSVGAGLPALTLAAAAAAALAVLVAVAATSRDRSFVAVVWCWVPAIFLMSARFFPRPEILSLLFLATFVYILIACGTATQTAVAVGAAAACLGQHARAVRAGPDPARLLADRSRHCRQDLSLADATACVIWSPPRSRSSSYASRIRMAGMVRCFL